MSGSTKARSRSAQKSRKPGWNDDVNDLTVYKVSQKEVQEKSRLMRSKNAAAARAQWQNKIVKLEKKLQRNALEPEDLAPIAPLKKKQDSAAPKKAAPAPTISVAPAVTESTLDPPTMARAEAAGFMSAVEFEEEIRAFEAKRKSVPAREDPAAEEEEEKEEEAPEGGRGRGEERRAGLKKEAEKTLDFLRQLEAGVDVAASTAAPKKKAAPARRVAATQAPKKKAPAQPAPASAADIAMPFKFYYADDHEMERFSRVTDELQQHIARFEATSGRTFPGGDAALDIASKYEEAHADASSRMSKFGGFTERLIGCVNKLVYYANESERQLKQESILREAAMAALEGYEGKMKGVLEEFRFVREDRDAMRREWQAFQAMAHAKITRQQEEIDSLRRSREFQSMMDIVADLQGTQGGRGVFDSAVAPGSARPASTPGQTQLSTPQQPTFAARLHMMDFPSMEGGAPSPAEAGLGRQQEPQQQEQQEQQEQEQEKARRPAPAPAVAKKLEYRQEAPEEVVETQDDGEAARSGGEEIGRVEMLVRGSSGRAGGMAIPSEPAGTADADADAEVDAEVDADEAGEPAPCAVAPSPSPAPERPRPHHAVVRAWEATAASVSAAGPPAAVRGTRLASNTVSVSASGKRGPLVAPSHPAPADPDRDTTAVLSTPPAAVPSRPAKVADEATPRPRLVPGQLAVGGPQGSSPTSQVRAV